jgi:hypothetical protein
MKTLTDALLSLCPSAKWTVKNNNELIWQDELVESPTESEIQAEIVRLQAEYEAKEYQRKRAVAYPSIQDQLDTLYHGGYEAWKATITAVKEEFPKP